MKQPDSILFISCKWHDTTPENGLSNQHHYLFGSLEHLGYRRSRPQRGIKTYDVFHFDEYYVKNHIPGDAELIENCEKNKPDLVFFDFQCGSECNPSLHTLEIMNYHLKIPVVAVWWDHMWPLHQHLSERVKNFVDLNVVIDTGIFYMAVYDPENYIFLWCPQDPRLYYNEAEKSIPMAFWGRMDKLGRGEIIQALADEIPEFKTGGGQGSKTYVPTEEYARRFRQTKIYVNFSQSKIPQRRQLVAHAIEATLSGAMLLEQKNPEAAGLFVPGIDYVEWENKDDLLEKAKYYLAHEDERARIASNGLQKASQYYNSDVWWTTVFRNL